MKRIRISLLLRSQIAAVLTMAAVQAMAVAGVLALLDETTLARAVFVAGLLAALGSHWAHRRTVP